MKNQESSHKLNCGSVNGGLLSKQVSTNKENVCMSIDVYLKGDRDKRE
jgi:hypothetical protein